MSLALVGKISSDEIHSDDVRIDIVSPSYFFIVEGGTGNFPVQSYNITRNRKLIITSHFIPQIIHDQEVHSVLISSQY